MLMRDQHLYKNPALKVFGYYYPDWGCQVDSYAILGRKIAGMGGWGLSPQH